MSSQGPGVIRQLWFKWKALRLPWRKQFLVGSDLSGTTFWEFRDDIRAGRWRRIAKYPGKMHHADVKLAPQWIQWLRHTRDEAPSIQEQQYEISRQAMMKQLAAEADERWKSAPRYIDKPERQQPAPATAITDSAPAKNEAEVGEGSGVQDVSDASQQEVARSAEKTKQSRQKKENPWQRSHTGAPSENWQPDAWVPGVAERR